MTLSRGIARSNRVATNRLTQHFATTLPGMCILIHMGRTSDRVYRTPVNYFRRDATYVLALTYGVSTDWFRNVLAADGCLIETQRRRIALTHPRLVEAAPREMVPLPFWLVLRLLGVRRFVVLESPQGRQQTRAEVDRSGTSSGG